MRQVQLRTLKSTAGRRGRTSTKDESIEIVEKDIGELVLTDSAQSRNRSRSRSRSTVSRLLEEDELAGEDEAEERRSKEERQGERRLKALSHSAFGERRVVCETRVVDRREKLPYEAHVRMSSSLRRTFTT
jgi:hypothetical protein